MEACKRTLQANGFSLSEVVSSQIWVTGAGRAAEVSKRLRGLFGGTAPAATISEVSALPGGATEDFSLVAAKGARKAIGRGSKQSFSPAILAGGALYISGQTSVDSVTGTPVQGAIGSHVKRSLENIGAILRDAGMDFSHVAQASVILTNPADFAPMGDVYRTFTSQPRPARVPLGATRLPGEAPVSITMIAHTAKGSPVLPKGMEPSDNYSRGYKVGDKLYVAGIGSAKPSMEECMEDVLSRVRLIVEAGGATLDDVAEARVYLRDMRDFDAMDRAFGKYFSRGRAPARSTVAVSQLPANLSVMASFVAVRKGR